MNRPFSLRGTKQLSLLVGALLLGIASEGRAEDHLLRTDLGKPRTVHLSKAPQSIEIANPDVVDVERVGQSNSVRLIPRNRGESSVVVQYPSGAQDVYQVTVGKEAQPGGPSQGGTVSASAASRLAREIQRLPGLEAFVEDGRISITGRIDSLATFRALVKQIAGKPKIFNPSYVIASAVEPQILRSLGEDLKAFGEDSLTVFSRSGLLMVGGIPSSAVGKERALSFLSSVLPNLVDATDASEGSTDTVQVTLQFLEVGRGEKLDFGVKGAGMQVPLSGSAAFAATGQAANLLAQPTLQIAPFPVLFSALKDKNFTREIAHPTILTRSGLKASFLAGGEIPLQIVSASTDAQASRIEFKPFGIVFSVLPKLQGDGTVWIRLDLEVSSVAEKLAVKGIPGFLSRKVNTEIILPAGSTAIISGLVQSKDVKQVEKFPVLGDLPIIGELFKSRAFKDEETELWVAVSAATTRRKAQAKVDLREKFDEFGKKTRGSLRD